MKKVLDTGHLLVVRKYTPYTAEVERVYHATVLKCTAKSAAFSSSLRWEIRQASQRSTACGKHRNLNRASGNSQNNLVPMLTACLLPLHKLGWRSSPGRVLVSGLLGHGRGPRRHQGRDNCAAAHPVQKAILGSPYSALARPQMQLR